MIDNKVFASPKSRTLGAASAGLFAVIPYGNYMYTAMHYYSNLVADDIMDVAYT